ncbi:lysozyme inhibitor LprI family protein [Pollutimonas bauzanensis]|uniref:lysozyme inhibitor LprI family protein n=1 Tax=Pollutimonas bauzanensis TaxID=658167 RepID=UPI00333E5499
MRAFVFIVLVFFGLAPVESMSQAHAVDCANASAQSTLNECADKDYKKSDAELNKLYKDIRGRLSDQPDAVKKLVAAQKAWVAFRDAECGFSSFRSQDGSAYPMLISMCRDGLTQTRVKDLKAYLLCEEGDLSCPVPPTN